MMMTMVLVMILVVQSFVAFSSHSHWVEVAASFDPLHLFEKEVMALLYFACHLTASQSYYFGALSILHPSLLWVVMAHYLLPNHPFDRFYLTVDQWIHAWDRRMVVAVAVGVGVVVVAAAVAPRM